MAEKFRFTAHLQSLSAIAFNYFVESWPGIRYASVREIHHPIAPVTAHTAAYDRDDHWLVEPQVRATAVWSRWAERDWP